RADRELHPHTDLRHAVVDDRRAGAGPRARVPPRRWAAVHGAVRRSHGAVRVSDRKRTLVVAGLIADGPRILLTQRRADHRLPLQWEFPGGKVEPGEAPAAALVRELAEEVGITVEVGAIWDVLFHAYPAFDLVMLVYICRITDGEARAIEVADVA